MADVPLMQNPMTTQDDIVVGGASGAPARLAKGTDGQILTVDPTTHHLVWADNGGAADILDLPTTETDTALVLAPDGAGGVEFRAEAGGGGGGGLVLLEQHTASSSATLDFTSFISSTYDSYLFDFVNVLPATSGGVFFMRMGTGAGPTWDTGAGNHGSTDWRWVPGGAAQSGGTATAIVLTNYSAIDKVVNTANLGGVNGFARLADPQSSIYKNVTAQTSWYNTGGVIEGTSIHGIYLVTTVVTGVQFLFDNGNIASGTIRVYGITKS